MAVVTTEVTVNGQQIGIYEGLVELPEFGITVVDPFGKMTISNFGELEKFVLYTYDCNQPSGAVACDIPPIKGIPFELTIAARIKAVMTFPGNIVVTVYGSRWSRLQE